MVQLSSIMSALAFDLASPTPSVATPQKAIMLPESKPLNFLQYLDTFLSFPLSRNTPIFFTLGPGSFTGIRQGISLALALHYAIGCPLIPVPTLDLVAFSLAMRGTMTIALPAGKWGWYYQTLHVNGDITPITEVTWGEEPPPDALPWKGAILAPLMLTHCQGYPTHLPPIQPIYGRPSHGTLAS